MNRNRGSHVGAYAPIEIDAPQGGHGDLEWMIGVAAAVAAGLHLAAAVGLAVRSWAAGALAAIVCGLAVPAVCMGLAAPVAVLTAPWMCAWPSVSGGQCENCARLQGLPESECLPALHGRRAAGADTGGDVRDRPASGRCRVEGTAVSQGWRRP